MHKVIRYTADEIIEYAPAIFKGEMKSIFDLTYEELPEVADSFDDENILLIREKFYEEIDKLKKEKIIKSTLEVELSGDVDNMAIKNMQDLEDWFVVSKVTTDSNSDELASFEVDDKKYRINKASMEKCPRCWKFTSEGEDKACSRCEKVVS